MLKFNGLEFRRLEKIGYDPVEIYRFRHKKHPGGP